MKIQNFELQKALRANYESEIALVNAYTDAQIHCSHSKIAECDFASETWCSDTRPTARICLHCGLMEEGWDFIVLKSQELLKIDRKLLYSLRQGIGIDWTEYLKDSKGADTSIKGLLLKEKTLSEILEDNRVSRVARLKEVMEKCLI
ncbi:MAG TPA: hypothetical protein VFM18_14315 [Methanosarcina sp.]|nr:hypothetical protein [Methanosarcina sp.]